MSRTVRALIVTAVASVGLLGCTAGGQAAQPKEYGDINTGNEGYYGNLMFGCTGVQANDDGKYVDVELESAAFCTCVFRGMKETVPFSEAKSFDEQQAEAGEDETIELPSSIDKVRTTCADDEDAYS
ncbi:MAG: hypothetical protein V9E94_08475 [Microthrixaceae bacterium]